MQYASVSETAARWQVSARSVRNYCAQGRVPGAILQDKTWRIPIQAQKPTRASAPPPRPKTLLALLRAEKQRGYAGGLYHKTQIEFTYNSNHMEGSRLTHEQTRYIFETNTIGLEHDVLPVDDIIETANHFRCVDLVLDKAHLPLTETFIKTLHATLKNGTRDSRTEWFAVGAYKKRPNEVGGLATTPPEAVPRQMKALLERYHAARQPKTLPELLAFHVQLERIHPFQDGNGRVGRLLLFKECLKYHITPFIIDESKKLFYYRGLREWDKEPGYLLDTCRAAQDQYQAWLRYFRVEVL